MLSLRTIFSAGIVLVAGAFVFQACSRQSEAERCEKSNGNNDCDPGLLCVQRECCSDTICCPPGDPVNGTTPECRTAATAPATDAGDTGSADTGTTDTGSADSGTPDTTAPDTATGDSAAADSADAG
jgi:hypothetical protein